MPKEELEKKLKKLEGKPEFSSETSSKRILFGGFGAAQHVGDREEEAQRRALRQLLKK